MDFARQVVAIVWKDVLVEVRSRQIVAPVLVFAILVLVVFNFALSPSSADIPQLAPGVLWVSFTFAGVLSVNRSFVLEHENGSIFGLMISPVSREALFAGKMLSNFIFIGAVELVTVPVFAVLFNQEMFPPRLLLVMFLATAGFSAVGSIFAALAINTRFREIMLPLLMFPVVVPVIISAVKATEIILASSADGDINKWLQMLVAFDLIFLLIASIAFEYVIEE